MKVQQKNLFSKRWQAISQPQQGEIRFQIELVQLLRLVLKPTVLFWHTPNGGWLKDGREGAKLRAMGQLRGVADLQFHWFELDALAHKLRRVLHLELKVGNRPQSDEQIAFELAVRLLGDSYAVVHTTDEAISILNEHQLLRSDVKICGRRW